MIRAACHCGAVRFEIADPPDWVLDCNCTLCRKYGGLWTYFRELGGQDRLLAKPEPGATDANSKPSPCSALPTGETSARKCLISLPPRSALRRGCRTCGW